MLIKATEKIRLYNSLEKQNYTYIFNGKAEINGKVYY